MDRLTESGSVAVHCGEKNKAPAQIWLRAGGLGIRLRIKQNRYLDWETFLAVSGVNALQVEIQILCKTTQQIAFAFSILWSAKNNSREEKYENTPDVFAVVWKFVSP